MTMYPVGRTGSVVGRFWYLGLAAGGVGSSSCGPGDDVTAKEKGLAFSSKFYS